MCYSHYSPPCSSSVQWPVFAVVVVHRFLSSYPPSAAVVAVGPLQFVEAIFDGYVSG